MPSRGELTIGNRVPSRSRDGAEVGFRVERWCKGRVQGQEREQRVGTMSGGRIEGRERERG
eukprot:3547788-Rhodomonas_salina.3